MILSISKLSCYYNCFFFLPLNIHFSFVYVIGEDEIITIYFFGVKLLDKQTSLTGNCFPLRKQYFAFLSI